MKLYSTFQILQTTLGRANWLKLSGALKVESKTLLQCLTSERKLCLLRITTNLKKTEGSRNWDTTVPFGTFLASTTKSAKILLSTDSCTC